VSLQRLLSRIRATGPITVADFMSEALAGARDGYYRSGDPLGVAGDFTTAPEISQMFGELIGAWLAERWQAMGSPGRAMLVELGPGRGSLMADALRATRRVEGFHAAIELHLVEINDTLRARQRQALQAIAPALQPHWHAGFADLPDSALPLLLVANEFFDALPIRQLQRTARGWHERLIDVEGGALRFVMAPGPSPLAALLPGEAIAAPPGTIAELSPASLSLMQALGERTVRCGGAALIVDYGRSTALGASLQAVADHRRAEPLATPGEADLSALVDFSALRRVALQTGARVAGPVGQGPWLTALGIEHRARALKAGADTATGAAIQAALARLIAPDQMGTLFQVLAVTDGRQSPPAGFA
jgi:NADH dehydrogenase [ubiquinone] 1 alpha subcomplex assembly factor 7